MKKLAITLLMLICSAALLNGQDKKKFDWQSSRDEITFGAGAYQSINSPLLDQGVYYGLDYTHYFGNTFGVRGGVTFVENIANDIYLAQMPLGISLRFPYNYSDYSLPTQLAYGTAEYVFSYDHSLLSALAAFLPFGAEIVAGITPGMVMGEREASQLSISGNNPTLNRVTVKSRFFLTADIGAALMLRVWRFNVKVTPQYHYSITGTFEEHTEGKHNHSFNRSFFSLGGSLSYMF